MTKTGLIEEVALQTGITKGDVSKIINATLETIVKNIKKEQKIVLTGFGSFTVVKRKAKIGRNPKTGEKIKIPATKVPKFSAGKEFRKAVK